MKTSVMLWKLQPGVRIEQLGLIPHYVDALDPRPVKEQFDDHYGFAGGWQPFDGFKMLEDGNMQYGDPGEEDADPPTRLLAESNLRDETIRFYEHAWVAIIQKDGSFEVCRMD